MKIENKIIVFALAAAFFVNPVFMVNAWAQQQESKKETKETPKKPVKVTSDTMEAYKEAGLVVFKGNVVAVEDFKLCSDELYVHYDDNREVSQILAIGNVRIVQEDKIATSGKAVYDRTVRTVVLTENPFVRRCSDTVKGDKITVYIGEDNSLVESESGGRVKAVIIPNQNCSEAAPGGNDLSEDTGCQRPR